MGRLPESDTKKTPPDRQSPRPAPGRVRSTSTCTRPRAWIRSTQTEPASVFGEPLGRSQSPLLSTPGLAHLHRQIRFPAQLRAGAKARESSVGATSPASDRRRRGPLIPPWRTSCLHVIEQLSSMNACPGGFTRGDRAPVPHRAGPARGPRGPAAPRVGPGVLVRLCSAPGSARAVRLCATRARRESRPGATSPTISPVLRLGPPAIEATDLARFGPVHRCVQCPLNNRPISAAPRGALCSASATSPSRRPLSRTPGPAGAMRAGGALSSSGGGARRAVVHPGLPPSATPSVPPGGFGTRLRRLTKSPAA